MTYFLRQNFDENQNLLFNATKAGCGKLHPANNYNATTLWPHTSIYNYPAFFLESKKFLNALLFHSSKQSI